MNLKEWKAKMRKKYGAARVVPVNSQEAWGCLKVGREILAQVVSPFGGDYTVFGNETQAQRKSKQNPD